MLRRQLLIALAGFVAVIPRGSAWAFLAEDTEVRVDVDRRSVQVGEPLQYTVEVVHKGMGQVPQPMLRDEIGQYFEVRGPSVSSSFRSAFVNGRASREAILTQTYVLVPLRPGTVALDASVNDSTGTRIASNPLTLEIAGTATGTGAGQPTAGERPRQAEGAVFLWATVDKERAYVGEQILYALDVYERTRFVNIQMRTLPTFPDFWTEELPEGSKTTALVDGMTYRVHPGLRRALFPQRAATLTIGAPEVTVGLRSVVTGEPLTIDVQPLPAEGQPPGFSANNVGRFSIAAAVDRNRVRQGEPLTLTVTIEGEGNVRGLDPGQWPDIPGMRRYDPKVDVEVDPRWEAGDVLRVGGRRVYEFLLIPSEAGRLTIPAHAFSFFDPQREAYQTVSTTPIDIDVEVSASGEAATRKAEPEEDEFGEDGELLPIVGGNTLPRAEPRDPWLTPTRWATGMLAVPAAFAVWAVGGVVWRRVIADEEARARARVRARRRALLEAARSGVAEGKGFHGAIAQLLQETAVARAGPGGIGLPRPELLALLKSRGVEPDDLTRLRELLDVCDEARFGAGEGTSQSRTEVLDQTLALIRDSSLARGRT